MIDDLETALEVEAARAGSTTGEATSVLDALPPPKRKLSGRGRWSWAAIALLVLVGGGALLAVEADLRRHASAAAAPTRARAAPVEITSATDYDPQGDGEEDRQQGRPRRRRQPDRDRLGNRALRLRHLRRDQDRARPRRRHLRDHRLAGDADGDDRPHRRPRAGTREVFAAAIGPAGRALRMGRTGRRGRRRRAPPRRSTLNVAAALALLPALDQQGLRSARPGRPLPGRDQRHQACSTDQRRLIGSDPLDRSNLTAYHRRG